MFRVKKIKPAHCIPQPLRSGKGRFVCKSGVTGRTQVKKFFAVLDKSPLEIARVQVRQAAEGLVEELRGRIESQYVPGMGGQRFGRPRVFSNPLHPFTLKEKRKKGQDPRRLIATGEYVNSISVVEEKVRKGWSYRVGFKTKTHSGGIEMTKLARILEYGAKIKVTDKMRAYLQWRGLYLKKDTKYLIIPSRPHWMPVFMRFKQLLRRTQNKINKNLMVDLRKALKAARAIS